MQRRHSVRRQILRTLTGRAAELAGIFDIRCDLRRSVSAVLNGSRRLRVDAPAALRAAGPILLAMTLWRQKKGKQ